MKKEKTSLEQIKVTSLNPTQLKTINSAIDKFVADKRAEIDADMYKAHEAVPNLRQRLWSWITSARGTKAVDSAVKTYLSDSRNMANFSVSGNMMIHPFGDQEFSALVKKMTEEVAREQKPATDRHTARVKELLDYAENLKLSIALSTCPDDVRKAISNFRDREF